MPVALALALLQAIPEIFSAIQNIRGTLSETDQTKVDAALIAARQAALADMQQLLTDLGAK